MTWLWRAVLSVILSLSAACDRDLYVGRDLPLEKLREDAGTLAPQVDETSTPDAGSPQPPPALPQTPAMQAEPAPAPPACEALHADCDGDLSNGCETDLMRDRSHCGACGTRCESPDCSCDNGKLALHCDSQHGDCDAMLSNGCETDLTTSLPHCGACQRACHTNGHDVISAMCVAGRCEVECEPRISPEEDCDGNPDNGCESYLMFDTQNCGACGKVCLRCEAGTCML
jgi:hypothetical protein